MPRWTALAGLAFIAAALTIGLALARLFCLGPGDNITRAIVFAVRNVALATAIAVAILGDHWLLAPRRCLLPHTGPKSNRQSDSVFAKLATESAQRDRAG